MMQRKTYQLAWVGTLLIAVALACNFFSGIRQNVGEARGTAGALVTDAEGIATQARGVATAFGESGAIATVKALATQQGPSILATGQALATQAAQKGFAQTAQAFATEQGSNLIATGQVWATEAAEKGLLQTAQAFVTLEPMDMLGTLQAIATRAISPNLPPEDIPVVTDVNLTNFYATDTTVSYFTTLEFPVVLEFYKQEMPAKGWSLVSQGTVEASSAAVLQYDKPDRAATVTLSGNPQGDFTAVVITIRSK